MKLFGHLWCFLAPAALLAVGGADTTESLATWDIESCSLPPTEDAALHLLQRATRVRRADQLSHPLVVPEPASEVTRPLLTRQQRVEARLIELWTRWRQQSDRSLLFKQQGQGKDKLTDVATKGRKAILLVISIGMVLVTFTVGVLVFQQRMLDYFKSVPAEVQADVDEKTPYPGYPGWSTDTLQPFSSPKTEVQFVPEAAASLAPTILPAAAPLCSGLIVPPGKRLMCRVPTRLNKTKQTLDFEISGTPHRGGLPILRARAVEEEDTAPRIQLEQLGDRRPLGSVSTEELYGVGSGLNGEPHFHLSSPGIHFYGALGKRDFGTYELVGADQILYRFTGNFLSHSIEVLKQDGALAARAEPVDSSEYQVMVENGHDAGLLLLCFLAIDKAEIPGGLISSAAALVGLA